MSKADHAARGRQHLLGKPGLTVPVSQAPGIGAGQALEDEQC